MALRFGPNSDDNPSDSNLSGNPPEPSGAPSTPNLPPGFDPSDFVVQHTSPDDPNLPSEGDFNFGDFEQDDRNIVPPAPAYESARFGVPLTSDTPQIESSATPSFVPPSAPYPDATDETAAVRPRRKVPILPLALAAFFIIAGGIGAMFFIRHQQTVDDNSTTQPTLPIIASRPTVPAPTTAAPTKPASAAKSTAPAPSSSVVIAPPTSTNALVTSLRAADRPTRLKFLKALWRQGANAKHRGDVQSARRAWNNILIISPNHPDICEALMQLPKKAAPKGSSQMRMKH